MTVPRRLVLSLLAACLAATPAAAASKGGEIFVKLTPITLEFWDQAGIFHMVNMDLSVVFHEEAKLDKSVADKIQRELSAMTWEDFAKGNPAATVKAVALDIVRRQKGGEKAVEVLVIKLMTR